MRKFPLIVVVVILIMGLFIMETSPDDRKVWNLNDLMKAEDQDSDVDKIMSDIFPNWTDQAITPYMFDYYENARNTVVEGTSYIVTTRFVGLNDEFAKVIGKGKAVTRNDVINLFALLPNYLVPESISGAVDRMVDAIADGITSAQELVTEALQRLRLSDAGPSAQRVINLTIQEAIYAVMVGYLLNGYGPKNFEEMESE